MILEVDILELLINILLLKLIIEFEFPILIVFALLFPIFNVVKESNIVSIPNVDENNKLPDNESPLLFTLLLNIFQSILDKAPVCNVEDVPKDIIPVETLYDNPFAIELIEKLDLVLNSV
jgi:hypothetical protein